MLVIVVREMANRQQRFRNKEWRRGGENEARDEKSRRSQ